MELELSELQKENYKHLKNKVAFQLKVIENKNNEYDELGKNPRFISNLHEVFLFELINLEQLHILTTSFDTRNHPNKMEDWHINYTFEIKHYLDEEWQRGYSGMDIIKLALEEDTNFEGNLNDAIKLLHNEGKLEVNPPNGNPIEYYQQGSPGYSEACGVRE